MASRRRDPLSPGHGQSPAITKILIDVPCSAGHLVTGGAAPCDRPMVAEVVARWAGRVSAPRRPAAASGMTEQRTDGRSVERKEGSLPAPTPLVLHVIPTRTARGGQREARALADRLDAPNVRHHRVLNLFDGPAEVAADFTLDHPAATPGVGFDPRLVVRLRSVLAELDPTVVVAHGSEALKYLVPAMIGRRRPLAYYAIGTYSGSERRVQVDLWRFLIRRPDVVAAEGTEVAEECVDPFRRASGPGHGRSQRPRRRRVPARSPTRPSRPPLVTFVGALTAGKRPDRFVEVVAALRSREVRYSAPRSSATAPCATGCVARRQPPESSWSGRVSTSPTGCGTPTSSSSRAAPPAKGCRASSSRRGCRGSRWSPPRCPESRRSCETARPATSYRSRQLTT